MKTDSMQKLLDMVCKKIDEIAMQNNLDANLAKNLSMLVDIKKDILTIQSMEDAYGYEDGYSSRGGRMVMNGNSYANGYMITPYDVPQGQYPGSIYSHNNRMGYNSYNNYSMNGSSYNRNGGKEEMRNHLQQMMSQAGTQEERDMVQRFMNEVERM